MPQTYINLVETVKHFLGFQLSLKRVKWEEMNLGQTILKSSKAYFIKVFICFTYCLFSNLTQTTNKMDRKAQLQDNFLCTVIMSVFR